MVWRRRSRWLEGGALILGLLSLGLWSRASLRSWAFQSAESRKLAAAVVEATHATGGPVERSPATASHPRPRVKTKPVANVVATLGRIEIPRLGIQAIVAEGTDASTLDLAVGHVPSTAIPGSRGNCGLAGHRDTFFRGLGGVRPGDVVRFTTESRTYTYRVVWSEVVEPNRIDTLDPTPVPSLTLVTCYPFAFVGHAPNRFIVRARQLDASDAERLASEDHAAEAHGAHASPILMAAGR